MTCTYCKVSCYWWKKPWIEDFLLLILWSIYFIRGKNPTYHTSGIDKCFWIWLRLFISYNGHFFLHTCRDDEVIIVGSFQTVFLNSGVSIVTHFTLFGRRAQQCCNVWKLRKYEKGETLFYVGRPFLSMRFWGSLCPFKTDWCCFLVWFCKHLLATSWEQDCMMENKTQALFSSVLNYLWVQSEILSGGWGK